jgi:hypothetical protein
MLVWTILALEVIASLGDVMNTVAFVNAPITVTLPFPPTNVTLDYDNKLMEDQVLQVVVQFANMTGNFGTGSVDVQLNKMSTATVTVNPVDSNNFISGETYVFVAFLTFPGVDALTALNSANYTSTPQTSQFIVLAAPTAAPTTAAPTASTVPTIAPVVGLPTVSPTVGQQQSSGTTSRTVTIVIVSVIGFLLITGAIIHKRRQWKRIPEGAMLAERLSFLQTEQSVSVTAAKQSIAGAHQQQ